MLVFLPPNTVKDNVTVVSLHPNSSKDKVSVVTPKLSTRHTNAAQDKVSVVAPRVCLIVTPTKSILFSLVANGQHFI